MKFAAAGRRLSLLLFIIINAALVPPTRAATNLPPVNTVPGPQATIEGVSLMFSGAGGNRLSVSDPDAGDSIVQVRVYLTAGSGTLTLASTTGITITAGADNSADVTMRGTLTDLNDALNGLRYTPAAGFSGGATLTLNSNDRGYTGTGGAKSDTDTVALSVAPVTNDPPAITAPAAITTNEDAGYNLTGSNRVTIADPDADVNPIEVRLELAPAVNGRLNLSTISGLTFSAGANGTASMTFQGRLTNVNNALNNLRFTPASNFIGTSSIAIFVSDLGSTGAGGAKTDTHTISVNTVAVNDAPVNSMPGAQSGLEDTPLIFSAANGNALSASDIDAPAGSTLEMRVRVSSGSGILTLGSTAGISITAGADASADLTMRGTLATLIGALDGLTYTPALNFSSAATLTLTTSDLGNTGSGGTKSDTDNLTINIASSDNDAPAVILPATATKNEDADLVFAGTAKIADPDAGTTNPIEVHLEVTPAVGTLKLSTTTGLTFIAGANNTASMTIQGTLTRVNNALNNLRFITPSEYNGTATLTISVNDLGSTGSGGPMTDSESSAITINAVNDPPINSKPATQTTTEEVAYVFTAPTVLSVSDIDAGANSIQLQLRLTSAAAGILTLPSTAGLTFTGGANNTSDMTFTGTLTAINAALNGLIYTPTANFAGTASLQMISNDLGWSVNGITGTPASDTDTLSINVSAVNDPPVNALPGNQNLAEGATLTFNSANGNLISFSDPDSGSSGIDARVRVSPNSGTLKLSTTSGLTFVSGANNTSDMTVRGSQTNINNALKGLIYTPAANFSGTTTLTLTTDDRGYSGSGGALGDSDSLTITVSNVDNDAPVITVPGPQSATEGTPFILSGAARISVADPDAESNPISVRVRVTAGVLSLATTSGLTFTVGGDDTRDMTFTGTIAAINTALDGMTYTPTGASNTLTLTANDLGYTGSGGPQTATSTVAFSALTINDAPVITVPGAQSTNEDTPLTFGSGSLLHIDDPDADPNPIEARLQVDSGTLTLSTTAGLIFTVGGSGSADMTFTGTLAAINTALDGLVFTPPPNFTGSATVTLSADDLGSTGSGGALTDSDSVTVTVAPVNDAPSNTVPGGQVTAESTPLVFGGNMQVDDIDAGANPMQVRLRLSSGAGTTTLSTTAGLSFTAGANGSSDMTFTGTLAAINTALNGLTYAPAAGFSGSATLTLTTNDLGSTGSGGAKSDSDSVIIDVINDANDAPVNHLPGTQNTGEGTPLIFNAANGNRIWTADSDADPNSVSVHLSVSDGTLTLATSAGLSFTAGADNSDSMTVSGTLAAINAALDGLMFTPPGGFSGTVTLTMTTDDTGSTGTGGAKSDSDSLDIVVDNNANSAPVNTVPGTQTTVEDTAIGFLGANSLSIADPDADPNPISVRLRIDAGSGTLTLVSTTGLSFTAGANGTDDMTFTGTLADVNAALTTLIYAPASAFSGITTLTLTTNDLGNTGSGGPRSDTDTVDITINPANDPPDAVDDSTTVNEDASVVVNVVGNDTDPDGDALNVSALGTPTSGSVVNNGNGTIRYTPTANFFGSDSFTYTVSDGAGGTDTATVFVTVIPVNDPPNAVNDALTIAEDTVNAALNVLANDTIAPDTGETLTITAVGLPVYGSAAIGAGVILYTPNPNYFGTDSFTYTVGDGSGKTDTAIISVTVTPVNDPPDAVDDSGVTVAEDSTVSITVLSNDTDPEGAMLTVTGVTGGTRGGVTTNGTIVTYTPSPNAFGTDSFTYTVSDGSGGADTATVSVTITPVNDNPTAVNDSVSTPEDTFVVVDVLANDSIAPDTGETLVISTVGTPAHGTAWIAGIGIQYTPATNWTGSDSFTYKIRDNGGKEAQATVFVTIGEANDPPNAIDDSAAADEDTPTTIVVLANDIEPEGQEMHLVGVGDPPHGTAIIDGDTIAYAPDANYFGSDSFTYTIEDESGGADSATVTVTVAPVNDPPDAKDDSASVGEDTPTTIDVLANDSIAPDSGETLTIISVTAGAHGSVTEAGGTLIYTPASDYVGSDSFTYTIDDGSGGEDSATVSIDVYAGNDTPDVNAGPDAAIALGQPLTLNATYADSDAGDTHTADIDWGDGNVETGLSVSGGVVTGSHTYTDHGAFTVTVKVTDSSGASDSDTLTVIVADPTGITVSPLRLRLAEGQERTYTVRLNTAPSGPVEITLRFDSRQIRVNDSASPVTVTLNDDSPTTLTVRARDNHVIEGNRSTEIEHEITASSAPEYPTSREVDSVRVRIDDDDDPNPPPPDDDNDDDDDDEDGPFPPPPPAKLCIDMNFEPKGVVRADMAQTFSYAINCRLLVENSNYMYWYGSPLYGPENIGVRWLVDLNVTQAIDVFSPIGLRHFPGDAVVCLLGYGNLWFLDANDMPRVPERLTSYLVDDFPGYVCATLHEPGTLVLVTGGEIVPPLPPREPEPPLPTGAVPLDSCRLLTTARVNLREQPSLDSPIVVLFVPDTPLHARAYMPGWFLAGYRDAQGKTVWEGWITEDAVVPQRPMANCVPR